jgi:hypothetical protein
MGIPYSQIWLRLISKWSIWFPNDNIWSPTSKYSQLGNIHTVPVGKEMPISRIVIAVPNTTVVLLDYLIEVRKDLVCCLLVTCLLHLDGTFLVRVRFFEHPSFVRVTSPNSTTPCNHTSFTSSYESKNSVTLHNSLVESNNQQFIPAQQVSAWVSISFLPVVPGTVAVSLGTDSPYECFDSFTNHFDITYTLLFLPWKIGWGCTSMHHVYLFLYLFDKSINKTSKQCQCPK